MTKADIINRVSEELGIDRRTVGLVIESFMKCVKDALGRERIVFLRGFGTFSLNLKSASNLNGNLNCSKELEHYAS